MDRSLLLLTDRKLICDMYYNDLVKLFKNYLKIKAFSFDISSKKNLKSLVENTNILLITREGLYDEVRNFVPEKCVVIKLEYGFLKEKIEELKSFSNDTKALICFHSYFASVKIMSLLYNYVRNIKFDVYKPEEHIDTKNYNLAIIGENSSIIPAGIKNTFNLGIRKISLSTLLSIANAGDISSEELEKSFLEYSKDIYIENKDFYRFYNLFSVNKIQFKTIMNGVEDYGILVCDNNFCILEYNLLFKKIFSEKENLNRTSLKNINGLEDLYSTLLKNKILNNNLIEYNRKFFMVSSQECFSPWNLSNYFIILFKDVTKIISLERSFKQQLAQKGHISTYTFDDIYGKSSAIQDCVNKAKKISKIDETVLITGESGTGKELFAQSIHNHSSRKDYPFIALNCAALPINLLESELFGYSEGTFTGAKKGGKIGLFEKANKGTFFLDEIGDISLETQVKLLRVLEEKKIMKLGSDEIIPIDVRIIAATNKNLRELVKKGLFRLDLYYRLNTLELFIPPIRERKEDIPLLISHILKNENLTHIKISKSLMTFFKNFTWEGNVREMVNCLKYMANISDGVVTEKYLPKYILDEYKESLKNNSKNNIDFVLKDEKIVFNILSIISKKEIGRIELLEELKKLNIDISDYKLRNVLQTLQSLEYLHIGKGRKGMIITKLGFSLLTSKKINSKKI